MNPMKLVEQPERLQRPDEVEGLERERQASDMVEHREFKGALSDEYRLLGLAYPYMEEFQGLVGEAVRRYVPLKPGDPIQVLEIGCGDGYTTNVLMNVRDDIRVTAVDVQPEMTAKARENLEEELSTGNLEIVTADALEYLRGLPDQSQDIVASVWTLHNLKREYRLELLKEVHRVLKDGGLLVNGDKYPREGAEHHRELMALMETFFDAYAQYPDFLRDFVLHNLSDESPDLLTSEAESEQQMSEIGFQNVTRVYRRDMEAVITATR